jgi:hypothetical protein
MYVSFLMSILHLISCVIFCQCHYFAFLTSFTFFFYSDRHYRFATDTDIVIVHFNGDNKYNRNNNCL